MVHSAAKKSDHLLPGCEISEAKAIVDGIYHAVVIIKILRAIEPFLGEIHFLWSKGFLVIL